MTRISKTTYTYMCSKIDCPFGFDNDEEVVVLYLTNIKDYGLGWDEVIDLDDDKQRVYHVKCFNKLGASILNPNPNPLEHIY